MTTKPKVIYCAFQPEIGANGTKHIQGCISFQDNKHFDTVKKLFPTAHIQVLTSSMERATAYCTKEDTRDLTADFGPTVLGICPTKTPGLRTDLQRLAALIKTGATEKEIFEELPEEYLKFDRGIGKAAKFYWTPRSEKTIVHWFYGPSGTGKTREAHRLHPDAYWKDSENHKWWDGYLTNKVVIIDEFRASFSPFNYLLRLFDRYPITGEVKGSTIQLNMPEIIITCPYHPKHVYRNRTAPDIQQLLRRIEHIRYYPSIDYPTDVHWHNQCQATIDANLLNRLHN